MSAKLLPSVLCPARDVHKSTLIFLHGLGDTGDGWSSMFRTIIPDHCKVICPNAPSIPVSLNGGMRMPAWYDIYDLSANAKQDEPGIVKAAGHLENIVEAEMGAGIAAKNIVIGGFSQGGAVAFYHALTSDRHYGGVVGLSTWLPMHDTLVKDRSKVKIPRSVSLFQAHGTMDMVVDHQLGLATHGILKDFGMSNCEFISYPLMGHSSNDKEMNDLKEFISKVLVPSS